MTYHFSTPEFQTDPRTQLIDLAADYARWRPVFPVHTIRNGFCSCGKPDCKRDVGKHPIAWLVPHGHTEATRDEALIRQWWLQEPDANIGLVTGDGLISLDVDGPKGQETLAGLTEKYGPVPKTLKVKTGRGEHLWFGYDQERYPYVKSTANTEVGLDIRADGGYVIAPPSKHYSGVTYEFSKVNREGLAEAPQWVLNYALSGCNSFEAIEEPSGLAGASDPPLYTQAEAERIRSALSAIPANKRDIWVRVGAALHSTGWGDPARQLYDDWSRTCPEKFDEAEQAKAWRSFDRPYDGEKVTLGTLFHLAKGHGWSDPSARAKSNGLPVIQIKAGNIEQIVDEAERALVASNRGLYQRAGQIVCVGESRVKTKNSGEIMRQRIRERRDHALVEDMTAAAKWERFDARRKSWEKRAVMAAWGP